MSSTYTITRCTPGEIAEISALDRSMWAEWANPPTLYRQLVDLFPKAILTARGHDGALAGFTVGLYNGEARHGWVLSIDISPAHRGRGLGKLLARSIVDELRAQGAGIITAIIAPTNTASQRLFAGLGFEHSRDEPAYFGRGEDQQRWVWSAERS